MLTVAGETNKRSREFVMQYNKSTWNMTLVQLHVVNSSHDP